MYSLYINKIVKNKKINIKKIGNRCSTEVYERETAEVKNNAVLSFFCREYSGK